MDGKIYDACDQADSIGLDHYKRASLSHGAAISDAMIKRFGKVAVVEDDSTSPVGAHAVRLAPTDLHGFAQAMAREDWSFFRMGWRQFTLEMDPRMECPRECKCDARTSRLCFVSSGGCDLRSSDSYIISERYYRWTVDKLISGGTIDYDVLPRAPGVLLTIPVLSAQKRLDINIEHQAAVSDLFAKRCLVGGGSRGVLARRGVRRGGTLRNRRARYGVVGTAQQSGRDADERREGGGVERGAPGVHRWSPPQRDREDRRRRGRGG